jgi:hypothetical protein
MRARGGLGLQGKPCFRDLIGRKTLINGDVRAGKTKLTAELLEEAVEQGHSEEITVIDMAPEAEVYEGRSIGGRLPELTDACSRVRYLSPLKVETPRLRAKTPGELLHMARLNEERIKALLDEYLERPSPILFVNDVSIFLQSGSIDPVLLAANRAGTFVANGYYGEQLSADLGTGVSERERALMDALASEMDLIISL